MNSPVGDTQKGCPAPRPSGRVVQPHTFDSGLPASYTDGVAERGCEDLAGGDLEYVEWAGAAKLLTGLAAELKARRPDAISDLE